MASIKDLSYQHRRPLSPIQEGGSGETVLVESDSGLDRYSPERHIFMATINAHEGDEDVESRHGPNEMLDQIPNDDLMVDAPQDKDDAKRAARRMKNERRAQRRLRATERACQPPIEPRNLEDEFAIAGDPIFDTPIATMTKATLCLMQLPRNPVGSRFR